MGDEAIDLFDNQVLKVGSNYTCIVVILFYSFCKKFENYYPRAFLKECKYIEKEKKVIRHITDDLKNSSDSGGSLI